MQLAGLELFGVFLEDAFAGASAQGESGGRGFFPGRDCGLLCGVRGVLEGLVEALGRDDVRPRDASVGAVAEVDLGRGVGLEARGRGDGPGGRGFVGREAGVVRVDREAEVALGVELAGRGFALVGRGQEVQAARVAAVCFSVSAGEVRVEFCGLRLAVEQVACERPGRFLFGQAETDEPVVLQELFCGGSEGGVEVQRALDEPGGEGRDEPGDGVPAGLGEERLRRCSSRAGLSSRACR